MKLGKTWLELGFQVSTCSVQAWNMHALLSTSQTGPAIYMLELNAVEIDMHFLQVKFDSLLQWPQQTHLNKLQ